MKKKFLWALPVLALCFWFSTSALNTSEDKGIQFMTGTLDQAIAQAKKDKKLVFVDAYTTWCGPCKLMAKKVFTEESVGKYYNENFVNLKLDMESSEGKFVESKYKVVGYPTFLYIDTDGKLVRKEMGLVDAETFIGYGKSAKSDKK